MTHIRRAAYIIIVLLMAVTVGHVASFTGSMEADHWAALGWPYALAVDAAIVMCGAFTRWKTTRGWAWAGYFAFTAASGALNVAAVRPWSQVQPWAAWIYAVFPTVAIALLGFLARDAEILAEYSERSKRRKREPMQEVPEPEPEVVQDNGHNAHLCAWCMRGFGTQQALNAHLRWCDIYRKREAVRE